MIVFSGAVANFGPGMVRRNDDPKAIGTDAEKALLAPADDFYIKLAGDCVNSQICVDLFVCGQGFMDLASIGSAHVCLVNRARLRKQADRRSIVLHPEFPRRSRQLSDDKRASADPFKEHCVRGCSSNPLLSRHRSRRSFRALPQEQ